MGRLSDWLLREVPGFAAPYELIKFDTGQSNPTFRIKAASGDYVLRRKPGGTLLKSAHAVDREFRVQRALVDTGVPVPRMLALCTDDGVLGTMFYVMAHVEGRTLFDPTLPEHGPSCRAAIMDEMNRVLAAIHGVDPVGVGLEDYGPPGDYYARQLDRWTRQYRATETAALRDMDRLIDWLTAHLPVDDGQRRLVHGDYRLDNLMFGTDGTACRAVIDWELSTLGHPLADLAGVLMQWHMPPGSEGRGLAGVDRAALGLPTDAEFVAAYCVRRGLDDIPDLRFALGFAFFRMGAILQGVKRRGLEGNASNPEQAARLGAQVPRFAELGLEATS